jgi:hypothetical protein
MKSIDRKRAPVVQEQPRAQLPALAEREAILSRARALVAKQSAAPVPASPQRAQLPALRPGGSQSSKAPVRNLPAVVKGRQCVPTRQAALSAPAVPRQPAAAPVAASQRMEVPPGQNTAAVQNSGSGQTIIVQVSAPQLVYPWWGPWWWGHAPAGCGARSCPVRRGRVCTHWLCGW